MATQRFKAASAAYDLLKDPEQRRRFDAGEIDEQGHELPSARNRNGRVRFTMRHEVQMENVLGRGDSWTMSGRQWGAWNAAYGPRGRDGRPVPLWDLETGVIDRSVTRPWG